VDRGTAGRPARPWVFDRQRNARRQATYRALRSPLPHFHNGFAADLDAAVTFYDDRFHIGFTKQDESDLVVFLRSL
jgi:hypothetical protein